MGHVAQTTGAIRCIKDGEGGGNTHKKSAYTKIKLTEKLITQCL